MTEYEKNKIKKHWKSYGIMYTLYGTMILFVVLIGLEAKGII